MKILISILFLLATINCGYAKNNLDSLSFRLEKMLENKQLYVDSKEQRIKDLKQMLSIRTLSLEQKYDINFRLSDEYKKYRSDSAAHYMLQNETIAAEIGRAELQQETSMELAWLYSTKGIYIESKNRLDNINKKDLPKRLLTRYYEIYLDFYSHYGQSNGVTAHYKKSELYRDSLLQTIDPQSLRYQIIYASKIAFGGDRDKAKQYLSDLLDKTTDRNPERAMIAYLLGYLYKESGELELQKTYFTISAITDFENCIKDNASLQSLALTYFETGDINKAYTFIQLAVDDAVFCNVRYRTVEASAFYPIINSSYQAKEEKRKAELQTYLVLISILSLSLLVGIVYIYKQMKRLSLIRKELYTTNLKLTQLNDDLQNANDDLQDANRVKEEYIAHFFDLCSAYIDKLENYRKSLSKKAANNQIDELFKMIKSNTLVDNEVEELYRTFDAIFINLYPTFVDEFNTLLTPEERILPKSGELLNTELRIFALIRLGITDSVKIASFLRYSLRTVYNYRTKVRNKAAVSRNDFEEIVKKIAANNKGKQNPAT